MSEIRFPLLYRPPGDRKGWHVGHGIVDIATIPVQDAPIVVSQETSVGRPEIDRSYRWHDQRLWMPCQRGYPDYQHQKPEDIVAGAYLQTASSAYWAQQVRHGPFIDGEEYQHLANVDAPDIHGVDHADMSEALLASEEWKVVAARFRDRILVDGVFHRAARGPTIEIQTRVAGMRPLGRFSMYSNEGRTNLLTFSYLQHEEMADAFGDDGVDMQGDRIILEEGFDHIGDGMGEDPLPRAVEENAWSIFQNIRRNRLETIPSPAMRAMVDLRNALLALRPDEEGNFNSYGIEGIQALANEDLAPGRRLDLLPLIRRLSECEFTNDAFPFNERQAFALDVADKRLAYRARMIPDDDMALGASF